MINDLDAFFLYVHAIIYSLLVWGINFLNFNNLVEASIKTKCKVVIFNYVSIGFNFVSNLIIFYQSFPYMFMGFNVMG